MKKTTKTINQVKKQRGKDWKKTYPNLAKYRMIDASDDSADSQKS